jgi:hypothetical protein
MYLQQMKYGVFKRKEKNLVFLKGNTKIMMEYEIFLIE